VRRHKSAAHQFVLSENGARATAAAAVAYFSDLFISRRCSSSQAILSLSSGEKVQAKVIIRLRHRRGLMIVMHVDRSRQVHTPFILHLLSAMQLLWLSLCVHAINLGYYSDPWRHLQQDLIFFM